MKKIIIGIIFLLFTFVGLNVCADTWSYSWSNTIVEVPLYANLNDYISKPTASLYRNGEYLADAEITISKNGDWLYYLSDVKTNVCGDYLVWYKASEKKYMPGTCHGYKEIITFRVVDNEPPKISTFKENISIRRGSSFNPLDNILVKDNVTKSCKTICLSTIDYNKVGDYECVIACYDEAGNQAMTSFNINIYETEAPIINYLGSEATINVELNSTIDLKAYFEAYDEIDGNITSKLQIPLIDTSKCGLKSYDVIVKNNAGLEATYTISINVVDSSIPVITLKNSDIILDYTSDIADIDWYDYVDSLTDNGEELSVKLINISSDLKNEVGKYVVTYTFSDGTNVAIEKLNVSIISSKAPIIIAGTITVNTNEYVDISEYVEIYDESDPNITSSLVINDEDVDYATAGKYKVELYAINSSGIEATKTMTISVIDNTPVATTNIKDIIIYALGIISLGLMVTVVVFIVKRKKEKNI